MQLKNLDHSKNRLIENQYAHLSNIMLVIALAALSFPGQAYSTFAFNTDFTSNIKIVLMSIFSIVFALSLLIFSYRLRTVRFLKQKIRLP